MGETPDAVGVVVPGVVGVVYSTLCSVLCCFADS